MADGGASSQPPHHRDSIKSSAVNTSSSRRRQLTVAFGKEGRETMIQTHRLCRNPVPNIDDSVDADTNIDDSVDADTNSDDSMDADTNIDDSVDADMILDDSALDAQISQIAENLKFTLNHQGKGAEQETVEILRTLHDLLSKSETPLAEAAVKAGVVPALAQCLAFGSSNEQLLEAALCLTHIAAGKNEEVDELFPVIPLLLIKHLGDKAHPPVAEQCAWALGNIACAGRHLKHFLLGRGALIPLARLMMRSMGSTARRAAWALSILIKGPDSVAATKLINIDGVLDAITGHLRVPDDDLVTEIAWVVVYLSALSTTAVNLIVKTDICQLLVGRLAAALASDSLKLLIPVLRSLSNLLAAESYMTNKDLIVGRHITDQEISAISKCLKSEHHDLKKEAAWALSNIAAGSIENRKKIFSTEAPSLLVHLLLHEGFDIKRVAAYALDDLCVAPAEGGSQPKIITDHLVAFVRDGCLPGFLDLVVTADTKDATLGLQFLEVAMRGMPINEVLKLLEQEEFAIDAIELLRFHEDEGIRNMANGLFDKFVDAGYMKTYSCSTKI